jgi:hypothetical protein
VATLLRECELIISFFYFYFDAWFSFLVVPILDELNEDFLRGFEDMVVFFTFVPNLVWGSWSVVQAKGASIDFDYLSYAKLRFDGYYYLKERFYREGVFAV